MEESAAKMSAVEARADAAAADSKSAVKRAEQREAIARSAAAAAARAQVASEAEVIRLSDDNKRLREEARAHVDAVAVAVTECETAVSAKNAAESAAEELRANVGYLEGSVSESQREMEELNAVLRARTMDITQLGQIIISVYKGEIQPEQLGEIASGIANIIGPQNVDGDSNHATGLGGGGEGVDGSGEGLHPEESQPYGMAGGAQLSESANDGEAEEEEEDTSVPVDSAFYGVEASEITWEEPLSVRERRARPKGMPALAVEKLEPPPDDPEAAMLEFAYDQQYGKEEAKRMIAVAKAAEAA